MPIATFSDDTSPEKCRKSFILKQFQDSAKGGTVQTALHFPFVLCNLRRKMGLATPRLVWLWLLCIFNGVQAMIFKILFSEKVCYQGVRTSQNIPLSWLAQLNTSDTDTRPIMNDGWYCERVFTKKLTLLVDASFLNRRDKTNLLREKSKQQRGEGELEKIHVFFLSLRFSPDIFDTS